jgi:signal transduction histidine kinase
MHSILSFARFGLDMIASKNVKIEKLDKYYSRITTSGNKLLKLLNNLLDLSKLDAGKFPFSPGIHSVQEAVDQVVGEVWGLAEEKSILIRIFNESKLECIWCDVEMVQQIVRNLLGNAIRFSSALGEIHIRLRDINSQSELGAVEVLQVAISDQGIGIPEFELEHIFNQFSQSSKTNKGAGGTGLGLAICKDLVELHKGKIFAENNEGPGATFTVQIPALNPQ